MKLSDKLKEMLNITSFNDKQINLVLDWLEAGYTEDEICEAVKKAIADGAIYPISNFTTNILKMMKTKDNITKVHQSGIQTGKWGYRNDTDTGYIKDGVEYLDTFNDETGGLVYTENENHEVVGEYVPSLHDLQRMIKERGL